VSTRYNTQSFLKIPLSQENFTTVVYEHLGHKQSELWAIGKQKILNQIFHEYGVTLWPIFGQPRFQDPCPLLYIYIEDQEACQLHLRFDVDILGGPGGL